MSTKEAADITHTVIASMTNGCDHGKLFPPKAITPNPVVIHIAENIAPSQSMLRSSVLKRSEPRAFFNRSRGGSDLNRRVTAVRQIKASGA